MTAPSSEPTLHERAGRKNGSWTAIHGLGMWLVGLGFGMGWAHQYTTYPAIWGAGLIIAGCMILLLYSIVNRQRR